MERKKSAAAGASKALRGVVNRLSAIRTIPAKHTGSSRRDCNEAIRAVERRLEIMTRLAIENAEAQGKPFRNPYVGKGERLYPVHYI